MKPGEDTLPSIEFNFKKSLFTQFDIKKKTIYFRKKILTFRNNQFSKPKENNRGKKKNLKGFFILFFKQN